MIAGRLRGCLAVVLAAATLLAVPAIAADTPSRYISTLWIIQPAPPPTGERLLAGGDFVLKQRLLPTGLAELAAPAALGSARFDAGTQLIKASAEGVTVYCRPYKPEQKLVGCLMDRDSDGDFEGWFDVVSQTKGLISVGQNYPKKIKPLDEIGYRSIPITQMTDIYFVAIERRNYFNIYSRESFMVAFGREGSIERLTSPIAFKSSEMPKQLSILGATFTAVAERDGKMAVTVERAMPAQPFGVIKTTSYRFY